MAWKDCANFLGLCESLVNRHRAATGIGEDDIHSLALETLNEDFRAVHNFAAIGRGVGFFGCGFFGLHKAVKGMQKLDGSCRLGELKNSDGVGKWATEGSVQATRFGLRVGEILDFLLSLEFKPLAIDFAEFCLEHL